MTGNLFDTPKSCGWCLNEPATTTLYGTPTCGICAAASTRTRVLRWQQAVYRRNREAESRSA